MDRCWPFGHPMFGDGATALPMASGFVHYVVPSHLSSFKLAGSGNLVGSIVRDESSAVLGLGEKRYATAPVVISVQHPDRANRTYRYQVVQHRQMTPMIAAIVTAESMVAEVGLPAENTLHVNGSLTFTGGHKLQLNSIAPGARPCPCCLSCSCP
ncbi:MAG: hypothetical protein HC898_05270 [Phycisphaerales bacterium]|nr:hypothetical protein [Phycisphaerales bacterium]